MKDLDFTPAWHRKTVQRRLARKRRTVWIVLLLASIGTWTLWKQTQLRSAQARMEALQVNFHQQSAMVTQAVSLQEAIQREQAREKLLRTAAGGIEIHQILAELSRLLPESTYLDALRIERDDRIAPPPPETLPGVAGAKTDKDRLNVTLNGGAVRSADVGRFVNELNRSPIFQDIKLNYSRPSETAGRQVREFEISAGFLCSSDPGPICMVTSMGGNREQLVTGAVVIAVLALFWWVVVGPQEERIAALAGEVDRVTAEITERSKLGKTSLDLETELQACRSRVSTYTYRIPGDVQLGPFLEQLAETSQIVGLRDPDVTPESPHVASGMGILPVRMSFTSSFSALHEFLQEIESYERVVRIKEIETTRNEENESLLTTELTLQIFYEVF